METHFSGSQIRELTSAINDGKSTDRAADKGKQLFVMQSVAMERLGLNEEEAIAFVSSVAMMSSMDVALAAIKNKFLEREGAIPTRLNHTVPASGDVTPAGAKEARTMTETNTNAPKEQKAPKAPKAPKEPKAPREPKVVGPKPGRGALEGKLISTADDKNWRREGSHGYKTVETVIANPGLTIKVLEEKGARRKDIMWDLENNPGKFVLTDDPDYVPVGEKGAKAPSEEPKAE